MSNFGESKEEAAELDRLEAKLREEQLFKEFTDGTSFADIPELVPEEQDPNVLFKNNWLAYGQSFLLTASTGVGKSSMSVQMAMHWTLGRAYMATPMRPLRIAIIQAEDSERDLAEQRHGMRLGLAAAGWSAEDIREAESRLFFPGRLFLGKTSDSFAFQLAKYQQIVKCDLIIINPVQSFFGGDVSDQEATSHFCRELLDPIMKDESAPCCIGVVTHTPKQKSGSKDGKASVDDYGEYLTAGSHEWSDWARAVLCFLKHGETEGLFDFKAAKRGRRLAWKDKNGDPTTKKMMKHAEGYIFWEEATDGDVAVLKMTAEEREAVMLERKSHDKGLDANVWHLVQQCDRCHLAGTGLYNATTLREYARKWWVHSVADKAVATFNKQLEKFGLKSRMVSLGASQTAEYFREEWSSDGGEEHDF